MIADAVRTPEEAAQTAVPGAPMAARLIRTRAVCAIVPCYQRADDLRLLLQDLTRVGVPSDVRLSVLVVDNASPQPLTLEGAGGLNAAIVRTKENSGGAGGFNEGLRLAIQSATSPDDLLWLIDSDARVEPGALATLIAALDDRPEAIAAGSALLDPASGEVFELGGRIDRRTGEYVQPLPDPIPSEPIEVDYLAACSLLVRVWAAERAGLMCDIFLSGDDVEWTMRLRTQGRGPLLAVPASRVRHPRPDRMRTIARYYAARNAFVALAGAKARARTRLSRALREAGRGISQTFVGRSDLAQLHLRGLRDASQGRVRGRGDELPKIEPWRPLSELDGVLRALDGSIAISPGLSATTAARVQRVCPRATVAPAPTGPGPLQAVHSLWRFLSGTGATHAIVSARARGCDWLLGQRMISIDEGPGGGFVVSDLSPVVVLNGVARALGRGVWSGARLATRCTPRPIMPAPHAPKHLPHKHPSAASPRGLSLSIVIVSYKRADALEATLRAIASTRIADGVRAPEVIVVDNASNDGSAERTRALFPDARLVALDRNAGIDAFNVGVQVAGGDVVLILDDDARPEASALASAMDLLDRRGDIDAVALHPRHPSTKASEWAFAEHRAPTDRWPFMGCGNLVRRSAWLRVGGYDPEYFLYRNDTDLALKLLASRGGHAGSGGAGGVYFDPSWVVWHDSPAAARKSRRWFALATRNWIWLCRRHGRRLVKWQALVAGWARAHQLAGSSLGDHCAVLRGAIAGVFGGAPELPTSVPRGNGEALRILLGERAGKRR